VNAPFVEGRPFGHGLVVILGEHFKLVEKACGAGTLDSV
jgi:hypothetical protein